ncbi:hypothetical protein SOCEGT47_013500 [Sorangium cellulosum]|uniref:Secreted protein n=1 Tax=Sorangium cellulosum TaxID=56 RepID=A0A4P2PVW2_SORCE|nr:hypothetical protein SOCEGT47_013500 [Sorangium cellulosum]
MRTAASYTLAMLALIGCSSPVPDDGLPDPDPTKLILLFGGRQERAPTCAPNGELLWEGWTAWDEDPEPDECEPCECTPAACVRPPEVSARRSGCPGGNAILTLIGGDSWDGACAAGAFSVTSSSYDSVTFEPPTLADCQPVSPVPAPSRKKMSFVRACLPDTSEITRTDFRRCYPPQDNGECWRKHPTRFEFPVYTDTRTCTPCSCGAPRGGKCTAQTTLYRGEDCSGEVGSVAISNADHPICTEEIDGEIAAMRSAWIQNEPGTCTPSTASKIASGKLERGETRVYCCNH